MGNGKRKGGGGGKCVKEAKSHLTKELIAFEPAEPLNPGLVLFGVFAVTGHGCDTRGRIHRRQRL